MPDLRELDLNQPDLANLCGYLLDKSARWIMLTDPLFAGMHLNNCIMATRIGVEVMKHYGVRSARAETVECVVGNRKYREIMERVGRPPETREELDDWCREGAFNYGVSGKIGKTAKPGCWNGHLVCLAEDVLLDLSLDQFNRPQNDIEFETLYAQVPREFLEGRVRAAFEADNGCLVVYALEPWNDDWRTSMDWNGVATYQHMIDKIIAEIDAMDEPPLYGRENPSDRKRNVS